MDANTTSINIDNNSVNQLNSNSNSISVSISHPVSCIDDNVTSPPKPTPNSTPNPVLSPKSDLNIDPIPLANQDKHNNVNMDVDMDVNTDMDIYIDDIFNTNEDQFDQMIDTLGIGVDNKNMNKNDVQDTSLSVASASNIVGMNMNTGGDGSMNSDVIDDSGDSGDPECYHIIYNDGGVTNNNVTNGTINPTTSNTHGNIKPTVLRILETNPKKSTLTLPLPLINPNATSSSNSGNSGNSSSNNNNSNSNNNVDSNINTNTEIDCNNCCVICMSNEKNMVLLPCKHLCLCDGCCYSSLYNKHKYKTTTSTSAGIVFGGVDVSIGLAPPPPVIIQTCPICRSIVRNALKIYVG